ncbi:MAG: barstar family protein [Bacteroidales bacterium]|nr:barstar family protein [Bacteroidales bacterium]
MKVLLGFPDCYGMNWDAMIACLSNIHYPYEQISEVALGKDETLFIYCKDL